MSGDDYTRYYVRLQASDKRYWHWRLAKRDRLDVFHAGKWHVMVAWTDLLLADQPTAEVTLMLRSDHQRSAERPAYRPADRPQASELGQVATPLSLGRGLLY